MARRPAEYRAADASSAHGERAVLRRIAARDTSGRIGDDGAVVVMPGERVVITTDAAETGVHLLPNLTPWQAGYRAAACSLSDLAAMAARPVAVTCTISAAHGCLDRADEVAAGVAARAREAGAELVGGDITQLGASPPAASTDAHWLVTVTCVGAADASGQVLGLAGARAGDELWVTGPLGSGRAALERRRAGALDEVVGLDRHVVPPDRSAVANALLGTASAATDLSDGYATAVAAMAAACGCGAVVDLDELPIDAADRPWLGVDAALGAAGASDDYELLVAIPPDPRYMADPAVRFADFAFPLMYTGLLADGQVVFRRNGSAVPAPSGFAHGVSS